MQVSFAFLKSIFKELSLSEEKKSQKEMQIFFDNLYEKIKKEFTKELRTPPKIAIIGPTGVGKSSTINALFGSNLKVSHSKAETIESQDLEILIKEEIIEGNKGKIIIRDMPGIDQDITTDDKYKALYLDSIKECDVLVWMFSATDRRISSDQKFIRDIIIPTNPEITDRIVFAVNKVDTIQPNNWNDKFNIPSKQQENNIKNRVIDISEKLSAVIPNLDRDKVVPFSAEKSYRLELLFEAMLKACTTDRAWILNRVKSISDVHKHTETNLQNTYQ